MIMTVVAIVEVGGVAIGGAVAYDRLSADDVAVDPESEISTAPAEIRTLSVDFEATGSLVYEPSITETAPTSGTVTSVVAAGTMLSAGDMIAVVDDVPVVWLDGDVPAWRTMTVGELGVDVAQLEWSLDALGFNSDATVTIDDEFTTATAAMVESWQETIAAPVTGRVDLGTAGLVPAHREVGSRGCLVDGVESKIVASVCNQIGMVQCATPPEVSIDIRQSRNGLVNSVGPGGSLTVRS